ncbi:Uncharacterized protein Fot_20171 [Forsythia ovata]|uniref:Uncharacterized protein n=1 Tax=Forsythia ovata TaxID=205694 RepID=A0ABD1VN47_9LAMI
MLRKCAKWRLLQPRTGIANECTKSAVESSNQQWKFHQLSRILHQLPRTPVIVGAYFGIVNAAASGAAVAAFAASIPTLKINFHQKKSKCYEVTGSLEAYGMLQNGVEVGVVSRTTDNSGLLFPSRKMSFIYLQTSLVLYGSSGIYDFLDSTIENQFNQNINQVELIGI